MATRSWGHRQRLLALGGLGVLLAVCGAVATVADVPTGPGVALTGVVLGCWEVLGLWLWNACRRPYVEFAQNSVTDGGELIVPSTQEAIDARNARLQAIAT
ncbi:MULTISPECIES: hypothetical protein [unclassified Streptomyces]|uniref:hypothetical protein n=1 Tax=unclassified Streptomyces TaxID=2593676 RepID=UPI003245C778